jgi:hypothetical protein
VHLISLVTPDPGKIAGWIAGRLPAETGAGRLVVLLDYLPLGPEGLALRAAAATAGATVVAGADVLPGFPGDADLLDAVREAGAVADAIVVRHPLAGAARAATLVSPVPVLSAGDGTGEDPLFAIADLAALDARLDGLRGKSVALCGDLERNRRVHSLAGGLLAAGARVLLVPARGAEPPEGFLEGLAGSRGTHPVRFRAKSMSSLLDMVDSWLITPDLDHQLSLFSDVVATSSDERRAVRHQVRQVDALWIAARRDERGEPDDEVAAPGGLPWRERDGREVLSPDRPGDGEPDPAASGPVRRAALASVLASAFASPAAGPELPPKAYAATEGIRCTNERCVACREPVRVTPAFLVTRTDPVVLECAYCGGKRKARYVGSRLEKRYHNLTSGQVRKIKRENVVFFGSAGEASAAGFVSSKI